MSTLSLPIDPVPAWGWTLLGLLAAGVIKLRYGSMAVEGTSEEVADLLGRLGYGEYPKRSLFPVQGRRIEPGGEALTPAGLTYRIPDESEIVDTLLAHPEWSPIEVIRSTYGDAVRSSGITRAAYVKALRRVKTIRQALPQRPEGEAATEFATPSDRRGEGGDRPPAA